MAQIKFTYHVDGDVPVDDEDNPVFPHFTIDEENERVTVHKYWNDMEGEWVFLNAPRKAKDWRTDADHGAGNGDHICMFIAGEPIRRLLSRETLS